MKKRILVIDDEVDLLEIVKARLEANDFEVETAISGREGLASVKVKRPDVIILDLMMPEMDGYAVLSKFKGDKATRDIPIIVLTALAEEDSGKKAIELGADSYIVKPFESDVLLASIRGFLIGNNNA